ncbi:MAG TPA: S8 family serine peptidase [Saprospiraceae bacterium]|nr:S8 family serine peptidase [Saprospiraceae bacterium]
MNAILANHQVVQYRLAFPGATNVKIQNPHEMHLNGDVLALKADLEATGLFSQVNLAEYYRTLDQPDFHHYETDNTTLPGDCMGCSTPVLFNDPQVSWELDMIGAACAWDITEGNPDIKVAVIDTEFDENHPDLAGKIAIKVGDDSNVDPGCYHGTQVTGVLTSNVNNGQFTAGIGNKTRIGGYVVEATFLPNGSIGSGCYGSPFNALWQAYLDGNKVFNLSWTGIGRPGASTPIPAPQDQVEAIREITGQGGIVVVAAGPPMSNNINGQWHSAYADIPGVINVTSIMFNAHVPDATPKNQWVDLSAPGFDITRIQRGGGIGTSSGTSLAAPSVAGTAALILSINPCLSPGEVEHIIKGTAKPVLPNSYPPGITGTGHLCAYQAVLAATEVLPGKTITQDETWEYLRTLNGNITIESGATLTIKSAVKFNNVNSIITVKPGGKLIVDGGRLSTGCDNTKWQGVEVVGNPSSNQLNESNQGVVELNNAIIENAEIGVSLGQRSGAILGGGILRAENSQFINNQRGIAMLEYESIVTFPNGSKQEVGNRSYIKACTFDLTDEYPYEAFYDHVLMDRVSGISLTGCSFLDSRDYGLIAPAQHSAQVGNGIRSDDARFNADGCLFSRMLYGVDANNISTVRNFAVQNSNFVSNYTGVSTRATNTFTVSDCSFDLGGFDLTALLPAGLDPLIQTGIFIDHCSGFIVEANEFAPAANAGGKALVGIGANNTNVALADGSLLQEASEVFGNTFTDLSFGNVANGENRGLPSLPGGLKYICNLNTGNNRDFAVYPDASGVLGTIADRQIGDNNVAAGNEFTFCINPNNLTHFDNALGNTIDYYKPSSGGSPLHDPHCYPIGKVNEISVDFNPCLRDGEGEEDEDAGGRKLRFDETGQALQQLYQNYKGEIDNGNTASVLNLIQTTTPLNSNSRKNTLISYSPWLSDAAVEAVIAAGGFSNSQKISILAVNPEALRRDGVWQEVLSHGFNSQQLNQLNTAKAVRSDRDEIELIMSYTLGRLHHDGNRLLRHYLSDTTGILFDSLHYFLQGKASLEATYARLDAYLQTGDLSNANTLWSSINQNGNTHTQQSDYLELKEILIRLKAQGRTLSDLNPQELSAIQALAVADEGLPGLQAQNILNKLNGISYRHYPRLNGGSQSMQTPDNQLPEAIAPKQAVLSSVWAVPNPANTWTDFHYTLPEQEGESLLQLLDINGRLIREWTLAAASGQIRWEPSSAVGGIYFYRLLLPDGSTVMNRLVWMP